jgi:hypothetical protein
MRSDTRALLRIFVWAGLVVAAVIAVVAATVLGGLRREVGISLGLGILLFGLARVVRLGFPGLLVKDHPERPGVRSDAPPDPRDR